MKQNIKHIINTSVLFLTGIVLAGCSSSDAPIEQPINPTEKYVMTVNASKGSDATTRALVLDGSTLKAYWNGNETVTVKEGTTTLGTLTTITPDATDNTKAKLSGTLDVAPSGTSLTLELCSPTYGSQDGTLAYIASNCDYATATTTVTYDDVNKTITGSASFINQQAIVKFTLQNAKGEPLAVDNLTVSAAGLKTSDTTKGNITITPTSVTNEIYAALRGISDTKVTLIAKKGSDTYAFTTPSNVSFADGKYYTVTAKLRLYEPLTLEAINNDTKITFINKSGGIVQFSQNLTDWDEIALDASKYIYLDAGKKVYFRGNNATYYPGSEASSITCSDPCYVYGNIMSLVNATDFDKLTSLPEGSNTFRSLFENNTNIINHSDKELLLPATTLRAGCYKSLFAGCTGLTRAPVLPAPVLVDNCYETMFTDCINLKYIKCLATDISATDCTYAWVGGTYGVSAEGSFVKASGMTSWTTGNNGIPSTSPPWTVTSE